jgi:hypothetical protein
LFKFEPINPEEYDYAEFDEDKVFTAFPKLENSIVELLRQDFSNEAGVLRVGWPAIKTAWLKHAAELEERAAETAELERVHDVKTAYQDNPLFGLF